MCKKGLIEVWTQSEMVYSGGSVPNAFSERERVSNSMTVPKAKCAHCKDEYEAGNHECDTHQREEKPVEIQE